MAQSKSFRLIVNLSNFYNDHRHRARIFVNENIQTIQDLQERISHIFQIEDFHLITQNEFLPPSEDVRILHNDEVLWAVPIIPEKNPHQTELKAKPKNKNESKRKQSFSLDNSIVDESNLPRKRKKSCPVLEEKENPDIEMFAVPDSESCIKKKKKKKRKKSLDESEHREPTNYNSQDEVKETKKVPESTSTELVLGCPFRSSPMSYKKSTVLPTITDQYLKQKKVNIVKIDIVTTPNTVSENNSAEVQEDRGGESAGKNSTTADAVQNEQVDQCLSSDQNVQKEKNGSSNNLQNLIQLYLNGKASDANSCDESEPKKSQNVAKKPKFFLSPSSRKNTNGASLNGQNIAENPPKTTKRPNLFRDHYAEEFTAPPNKVASLKSATELIKTKNDIEEKILSTIAASERILQEFQTEPVNRSDYSEISSISAAPEISTSDISGTCEPDPENSFLGISGVHRIKNFKSSSKQLTGVGCLLDELRSVGSTVSLDSTCDTEDTSEFVTQRTRKRHRKRRTKSNVDDSKMGKEEEVHSEERRPMNVKGTPSIHIKFSEEGESINDSQDPEAICNRNRTETILIESECDEEKIGEEVIHKSPLMDTLLPKAGDVIAFKVLKLAQDYKPSLSSYITGKVTNFNCDTKCVYFEILGGLDQCQEPVGKFSVDIDEYTLPPTKNRLFSWTELIEPRLLFP